MLRFKQFLKENIKIVKIQSFQSSRGGKVYVSAGDKNFNQAINNLPEFDNAGEVSIYRSLYDPKRKKFYTWHAFDALHFSIIESFGFRNNTVIHYTSDPDTRKFERDERGGLEIPLSGEKKYFKGMREGEVD